MNRCCLKIGKRHGKGGAKVQKKNVKVVGLKKDVNNCVRFNKQMKTTRC